MQTFTYDKLREDNDAIRLVTVSGIDEDGFLNVHMHHAVIQKETYIALSYVWGSDPAVYEIKVNGQVFRIRPNLWSSLTTNCTSGQNLWIDALCIDQDNVLEKNRQVPLMGHIFSNASKVLCWLHGSISAIIAADRNRKWTEDMHQNEFDTNADLIAYDLLRLSKHTYWSRLWIVQELQLGQHIEVRWDGHVLDGVRLAYVLDERILEQAGILVAAEAQDSEGFRQLSSLLTRRDAFLLHQTHKEDLFTLVLKFGHLLGSLRQDRVYALLALASDGADFRVDYTEPRTTLLARLLYHCKKLPPISNIIDVAGALGIEDGQTPFEIITVCQQSHARSQSSPASTYQRCAHCSARRGVKYPDLIIGIPNIMYFGLTLSYTVFGPRFLNSGTFTRQIHHSGARLDESYSLSALIDIDRVHSVLDTGELHEIDFNLSQVDLSHFSFDLSRRRDVVTFTGSISRLLELLTCLRQDGVLQKSARWMSCSKTDLGSGSVCAYLERSQHEILDLSNEEMSDYFQHEVLPIPRVIRLSEIDHNNIELVHFILVENKTVTNWAQIRSIAREYTFLRLHMLNR